MSARAGCNTPPAHADLLRVDLDFPPAALAHSEGARPVRNIVIIAPAAGRHRSIRSCVFTHNLLSLPKPIRRKALLLLHRTPSH